MQQIDLTQTHDVIGAYHQCDFAVVRHKYHDPATKYAFDVLDEKIISGYLIKLAAFRHLRDLVGGMIRIRNASRGSFFRLLVDRGKPT